MIKIIIKNLIIGLVGVFLTINVALAEDSASNDTTGAESTNNATVTENSSFNYTSVNDASAVNDVQFSAATGGNQANYNTGDGTINTGNASGEVEAANEFNKNTTNTDGISNGNASASNTSTGAKSINNAWVKLCNSLDVKNFNFLKIKNLIKGSADTGNNDANYNTGDGSITTGDASVKIKISNEGNINETNVGGMGGDPAGGMGGGPLPAILGMGEAILGAVTEALTQPTELPRAGSSLLLLGLPLTLLLGASLLLNRRKRVFSF